MNHVLRNLQTLLYHRVCADKDWYPSPYVVSASTFRRHVEFLHAKGCCTPRLAEVLDGTIEAGNDHRQPLLITLDDGYLDNFEHAFPVLQEFGFRATIFLVADFSRRDNWWDTPTGVPRAPLLQPGHIKEMSSHGMEFGSHTLTHPHLPMLSDEAIRNELVRSREVIEALVQKPALAFSYPYSDLDGRVRKAVMDAKYTCAFAVNTGPRRFASDLFEIRRLNVVNAAGPLSLLAKLSGLEKAVLYSWWRGKRTIASVRSRRNVPILKENQ